MTKHEGGRYHDGKTFLPWYTSPCLEWLLALDLKDKKIFEYGTGDSTLWYMHRGADVCGVDSNILWSVYGNTKVITDENNYLLAIYGEGDFDIVVVDGSYRDECSYHALKCLKPGGYLILENWEQATVYPDWPLTKKLIQGMEQTLYLEPNHWDRWSTLVVKKPL